MKKAFDQTVRDLKREVNKKVLKVPSIEQKVLDATSNEPWGPHGTLLADIAQATRNYHECQMIMGIIWKRINDTGKNWRHVYKGLTVLEYLVAYGSDRVIDDIREHGYQISMLSNFQYIDSSGRDQGNNVRKKSQIIVALVNDGERIQEVRQKAAANRDKYRNSSMGSRPQPGSYLNSGGYGDGHDDNHYENRYGNRDGDHYGYGRDRDSGYNDKFGRYGDREGEKYGKDNEERYGQDSYRDDNYRGRGQSMDEYNYGTRSSTADRDQNHLDDGDHFSSRGSGAYADESSQFGSKTGKRLDGKVFEQSPGSPPSYEEVVNNTQSPYSDRENSVAAAPKEPNPVTGVNPSNATSVSAPPHVFSSPPSHISAVIDSNSSKPVDVFDEFDPRVSVSAVPTSNGTPPAASVDTRMGILDSLSESFPSNSLALVPITTDYSSEPTFSASTVTNQPFGDAFGDAPFQAIPSTSSTHPTPIKERTELRNTFDNSTNMSSVPSDSQHRTDSQSMEQNMSAKNQDIDMLADILPPTASSSFVDTQNKYLSSVNKSVMQTVYMPQTNQTMQGFSPSLTEQNALQNSFQAQQSGFPSQNSSVPPSMTLTVPPVSQPHPSQTEFHPQSGFPLQMGSSPATFPAPLGGHFVQPNPQNPNSYQSQVLSTGSEGSINVPASSSGSSVQNFHSQTGSAFPLTTQTQRVQQPSNSMVSVTPSVVPQSSKDKFETKSSVWADTLSRGLVNLNISGSKTNPLATIGVDFDAINRREKRMEKPNISTIASTVMMGKAMGSGSGIGRAAAIGMRPSNSMTSSGVNANMIGGAGLGMGMGGVGHGVNQPISRGIGIGPNAGINQGIQVQQPVGFAPGSFVPGSYNPMMGSGNFIQRPYGGRY